MTAILSDAKLLAQLVSFDSTSSNSNLPIADFICDYVAGPGVAITRQFNDDKTKTNLIIQRGPTSKDNPRSGLILSGHMDVVPANEPAWLSDPFKLCETQDAYVGRGACDMKGFDAIAINTFRRANDWSLTKPLVLILTFDEELGTLGAQHFVANWDAPNGLPSQAVIGEPTSLRVVRMHKGHLKMRITLHGRGGHSAYPHLGTSAIEPAAKVVAALTTLREELADQRTATSPFFPDVPFATLNVGLIEGGTAINVIPEACVIQLGVRPLPGSDSENIIERVKSVVHEAVHSDTCTIEVINVSPPLLTEESEFYHSLCKIVSQQETAAVSYASDAGPFQSLDIQCLLFGPGTIEVAHKPNESIPKAEFVKGAALVERMVRMCCCH